MKSTRVKAKVRMDGQIVHAWAETDHRKIHKHALPFGYVWARLDEHHGEWIKCQLVHI